MEAYACPFYFFSKITGFRLTSNLVPECARRTLSVRYLTNSPVKFSFPSAKSAPVASISTNPIHFFRPVRRSFTKPTEDNVTKFRKCRFRPKLRRFKEVEFPTIEGCASPNGAGDGL